MAGERDALLLFVVKLGDRTIHPEDVVQETLLRALRRGEPSDDGLRRWLHAIARRVIHEARHDRARAGSDRRSAAELLDELAAAELPHASVQRAEIQRIVAVALDDLPTRYRSILVERYVHGLSVAHISRSTGIPSRAVDSLLRRAHRTLRERLARRLR